VSGNQRELRRRDFHLEEVKEQVILTLHNKEFSQRDRNLAALALSLRAGLPLLFSSLLLSSLLFSSLLFSPLLFSSLLFYSLLFSSLLLVSSRLFSSLLFSSLLSIVSLRKNSRVTGVKRERERESDTIGEP